MRLETLHRLPGHLVRRLNQISGAIFSGRIGTADITSVQYAALVAIASESEVTASRLSSLIAFDAATLGGVVDRLEDKGLVRRTPSGADRRAKRLALTPAGRALLGPLEGLVMEVQQAILEPLDEAERVQFLALLEKLVHAPRAQKKWPGASRASSKA